MKPIILDYGHGGVDDEGNYTTAPAKQAEVDGEMVYEGVLNRKIGRRVYELLELQGYHVVETVCHDDPTDVSLRDRVRYANNIDNAVFVSIHCNAFNGQARGFEIFTTRGQNNSDKLAQKIADRMKVLSSQGLKMRFDESDGDSDKEADFYVIRHCKHPSVLVECLFFDNAKDLALLNDDVFFDDMCNAIADGIIDFVLM